MNEQVQAYLEKFPCEIADFFCSLRAMVMDCAAPAPEETMWARMPSYYAGENFIRLIAFKDHINVEARAVMAHRDELPGYRMTPKGMLQIFAHQEIPEAVLRRIFAETLAAP